MGKYLVIGHPKSTSTQRALMALEEKEASYEFKSVNFESREHKSPEYLEKEHPFGQIPVLHDDDFVIYESRAICRYIDDVIPGHQLVPRDPKLKGLVEQFVSIESSNYQPANILVTELVFKRLHNMPIDNKAVEENTKKLHNFYEVFDKIIGSKTYLVGDNFTLADLVFMPMTQSLLVTEELGNVLNDYPNINRWWQAVSSRPAWKRVLAVK